MNEEVKIDRLMNLENAIFVCFGSNLDDDLPQIESDDEALIDAIQDTGNLTRSEAASHLHGQM